MSELSAQFLAAVEQIDAANAADPNSEVVDGRPVPKELLYAWRMTQWLERLEPEASEPLRLAVRGQHICRWRIPRGEYPMTRTGYLRWRTTLGRFHAETAAQIMRNVGYDDSTTARVQSLLRKEGLKRDPEAQTLEDCACLVFLENHFTEFAAQHDEAKVIGIVQKTWGKMSPRAREEAIKIELAPETKRLIEKALSENSSKGARAAPSRRGPT